MRSIVIVQARQGSSRLPGKSTMPVCGRSSLLHLLDSLARGFPLDAIYVATSSRPENDVIREMAGAYGVRVVSGDEANVASRYLSILEREPEAAYFFRVCGDSPLYDHRIMMRGQDLAARSGATLDLVTSMPQRGYPQGMNLEMVSRPAFLSAYPRFFEPGHFEHVTTYFYERLADFDVELVHCGLPGYDYPKYKFSVDTADDARRIASIMGLMDRPHFEYSLAEKCRLYDQAMQRPADGSP